MTEENHLEKVECFYKTMTRRDPHKRQVKLVKPHLLQLDFAALGESSDDSDFKLNSGDEAVSDKEAASSDKNSSSDSSSDSRVSDDEAEIDDDEACDKENMQVNDDINKPINESMEALMEKVSICSVCLEDSSTCNDEIIECDGCFITVHEGCLGVPDSQSISSSESSSSTEPWFCDACKAAVKPHCELCPNRGGLFKETDTGKWVHLVCALYISGVAFGDVEKLNNVTLFEMPYTKWGSKECSLCDDRRYSRSGVCISCDAGMCRTHFHVTCGQKEGLLTEAAADEDIADPFFAHCKQHVERQRHKHKKHLWAQLNNHLKQSALRHRSNVMRGVHRGVEKKLHKQQLKYRLAREARKEVWVPKEKLPRLMLSSPYVLRQLFRKAELQGVVQGDLRQRKGYINPGFNSSFIHYYNERNKGIGDLQKKTAELDSVNVSLKRQQQALQVTLDALERDRTKVVRQLDEGHAMWCELQSMMEQLTGQKLLLQAPISTHLIHRPPPTTTDGGESREERGENKGMKLRDKTLLKETSKFSVHQQERLLRKSRATKRLKADTALSSEDSKESSYTNHSTDIKVKESCNEKSFIKTEDKVIEKDDLNKSHNTIFISIIKNQTEEAAKEEAIEISDCD